MMALAFGPGSGVFRSGTGMGRSYRCEGCEGCDGCTGCGAVRCSGTQVRGCGAQVRRCGAQVTCSGAPVPCDSEGTFWRTHARHVCTAPVHRTCAPVHPCTAPHRTQCTCSHPAHLSHLFPLPPRPLRAVFEEDAAAVEILPNAIRLGEIAAAPRVLSRFDQCF